VPWGFVNVGLRSYYAEGSKTLGYEIAEQLGWQTPDVVVSPIASGSLYTKLNQAFTDLAELGLVDGDAAAPHRRPGRGLRARRDRLRGRRARPARTPLTRSPRSLAIGSPADGDLAVATARASGGAIHAVAEDAVGECMALLAETSGVFGETAAGVTLGALR
jgi:threonine synthase